MSSSYRMLIAGVSAIAFIFALGIYVIVFGPFFSVVIPFFKSMTPPYWWAALGGNNIVWIAALVLTLIVLGAIFIVVRMFHEASRTTSYQRGDEW